VRNAEGGTQAAFEKAVTKWTLRTQIANGTGNLREAVSSVAADGQERVATYSAEALKLQEG
jgi:hypothetical protein